MNRPLSTLARGIKHSIKTVWFVLKIVVPVALVVTIINNTILIDLISDFFMPFMGLFGLSGKAVLPLMLGFFIGTGEAAGAILALSLSVREITIIAVMVGLCNSLIGETLIYKKISRFYWKTALIRLVSALGTGAVLRFVI